MWLDGRVTCVSLRPYGLSLPPYVRFIGSTAYLMFVETRSNNPFIVHIRERKSLFPKTSNKSFEHPSHCPKLSQYMAMGKLELIRVGWVTPHPFSSHWAREMWLRWLTCLVGPTHIAMDETNRVPQHGRRAIPPKDNYALREGHVSGFQQVSMSVLKK